MTALNLIENTIYELTANNADDAKCGKITVLHVKLTDSALKAIEEFHRLKDAKNNPTIKFEGTQGVIRIPTPAASGGSDADEENSRKFGFVLASVYGGQDGSFECIRQASGAKRKSVTSCLESVGVMTHKLTVQASDDVYQKTLVKMSLAEEESKKARTKEIKPSGPNISRRVRNVNRNNLANFGSVHSVLARRTAGNTVVIPPPLNPTQPTRSNNSTTNNTAKKFPSDIKHIPLRDRVIHQLALKSYTKPELLLRLKKDGILEKDKNSLGPILSQVATLNVKENSYSLQRNIYNEISIDWPLYTDDDKLQLSRKMLMVQSALASDTQTISPCHSVGSHGGDTSPASMAKKRRIAHTRRGEEGRATPTSAAVPLSAAAAATVVVLPVAEPLEPARVGRLRGRPSISDGNTDKNSNTGSGNPTSIPADCDDPTQFDYVTQYTQITSPEQKRRYRKDFDSEYDEYCRLHERVFPPTQKFEEFNRRLKEHSPGSVPYEKLRQDVLSEYSKIKSNIKYLEDRRRFEYLHRKLAHIKKLVQDFDNSNKST